MASEDNPTQKETTEVRETKSPEGETVKRTVTTDAPGEEKASNRTIVERVIYYVGGVIMALLAVRFILALLGANRENAFADLVFSVSGLFAQPFFGLFAYEPQYGISTLELGTLVAIIIYGLLTVGVAKLVGLSRK